MFSVQDLADQLEEPRRAAVLQPDRGDLAAVEQRHAVVQIAIDHEHRTDQHRRAKIGRASCRERV